MKQRAGGFSLRMALCLPPERATAREARCPNGGPGIAIHAVMRGRTGWTDALASMPHSARLDQKNDDKKEVKTCRQSPLQSTLMQAG